MTCGFNYSLRKARDLLQSRIDTVEVDRTTHLVDS